MRAYCRRGGFCEPLLLGISSRGVTVRLCTKGGEIRFTDRTALGLPAQPAAQREPLDAEAEQLYREEMYA